MLIDLFYPYVPRECIEEVSDTLRSRFVGQGPKVELFEKAFSEKFNVPYVVSLNSGTSALDTAYDLVGLKEGDEVITTPLTCTATNLPLIRRGVKLIWADVDNTLCIDPIDVLKKITNRTKAIVQVHLGGIPAHVSELSELELTNSHTGRHIPVISDAAQGLGIFTGNYTCCSFQAIKHITTGDGGMLVCDTERHRNEARLLRWFGIDRQKKIKNNWQAYTQRAMTFDIQLPGTKRHMNDIAASMGIASLVHYDEVMEYRRKIFNIYKTELSKISSGIKLVDAPGNTHWLATVLVERRDDFARMMFEADIDTNLVQVRNDIYKVFGGVRQDLPMMNELEDKYLSIPLNMRVSEDDAFYITRKIAGGW